MNTNPHELGTWLKTGGRCWLFLDYDGTLAPFAPSPEVILPDKQLIDLIHRLAQYPECLRVVILTGRRLGDIEQLLPVEGILLAGTYGIEIIDWDGQREALFEFKKERPFLDQLKEQWEKVIGGRREYYLEDKGFALAIHARPAPDHEARETIAEATRVASELGIRGTYRILGGHKFVEIAPVVADKGQSIGLLLKRFEWPKARVFYFGDDDKDESAFQVVQKLGGTATLVGQPRETYAEGRLEDPFAVRAWLSELAEALEKLSTDLGTD